MKVITTGRDPQPPFSRRMAGDTFTASLFSFSHRARALERKREE